MIENTESDGDRRHTPLSAARNAAGRFDEDLRPTPLPPARNLGAELVDRGDGWHVSPEVEAAAAEGRQVLGAVGGVGVGYNIPPTLARHAFSPMTFHVLDGDPVDSDWCSHMYGDPAVPGAHGLRVCAQMADAGVHQAEPDERCGRCRQAFDPSDTSVEGRARYRDWPFCRGCISRCHESTDAFHECAVCRWMAPR